MDFIGFMSFLSYDHFDLEEFYRTKGSLRCTVSGPSKPEGHRGVAVTNLRNSSDWPTAHAVPPRTRPRSPCPRLRNS